MMWWWFFRKPRILKLNEGDVLVLHLEGRVPNEQLATLNQQLRDLFPRNKVLILDNGMGLEMRIVSQKERSSAR